MLKEIISYIPCCDLCGEEYDDDPNEGVSDLDDWKDELEREGWLVVGDKCFCPNCKAKAVLKIPDSEYLMCKGADCSQCYKCERFCLYDYMSSEHSSVKISDDELLSQPTSKVFFYPCEYFIDNQYQPITT